MPKTIFSLLLLLLVLSGTCYSQCITALSPPDCNGSEPLITEGDIINGGTTKWYYGSTSSINTLTVDGGTLVVCGDLTVDKFYMTTGKIFIRPGARFVIGSGIGAGLQFKGDCAIYNYGTCEIRRNLTLENNAAAATPNIVMNVLSTSVFLLSNQYFVINNAHSWFVNNGRAECWGIITDAQSSAASVCLGSASTTKMAILINKVANAYTVSDGTACVYVYQFSEFYGQLTSSSSLLACLGSTHTSSTSCIPFGCHPNYWGSAQVFTNCAGCATIMSVLPISFISFRVDYDADKRHLLQWETGGDDREGYFSILRSADGKTYTAIDSISIDKNSSTIFNAIDKQPLTGNNYYMIRYTNRQSGIMLTSKIVRVISKIANSFSLYPVPFDQKFFIHYIEDAKPMQVLLTDMEGRQIPIRHCIWKEWQFVEVTVQNKLRPGLYVIYMKTDKSVVVKTILKE